MAVVLLTEHPGEAGAFLLQHLVDIGRVEFPMTSLSLLVFLHHEMTM